MRWKELMLCWAHKKQPLNPSIWASQHQNFLLSLVAFAPRSPLSRSTIELVIAFANAIRGYEVPTMSAFRKATESLKEKGAGTVAATSGSAGTTFFTKSIKDSLRRVSMAGGFTDLSKTRADS